MAAITPYTYELSFGVRKDWPELIPILEKILASISEREKQIIKEKWIDIRFQKQIDWQWVIGIGLGILLIAAGIVTTFLLSNRRLAQEIVKRQQAEKVVNEKSAVAAELKKKVDALKAEYDKLLAEKLAAREALVDKTSALEQAQQQAAEARTVAEEAAAALDLFRQAYPGAAKP